MSAVTASEQRLHDLCTRSFLSYWSFPNPYRSEAGVAKEICDALVVCGQYVLAFSDKSIEFPKGDVKVAWDRWFRKSVRDSVKQLQGASRLLNFPQPAIFSDHSLKKQIRIDIAPLSEREVHLIAVANGATEASWRELGESVATLMVTNDSDAQMPFMLGNVSAKGPFVHVFTDASLSLVMREFDTLVDLVGYLQNRRALFEDSRRFMIAGEEDLIALYWRGFEKSTKTYDMRRALPSAAGPANTIAIDGGFWSDLIQRPEYQARIAENHISYIWDRLIEKFTRHQLDGTGISIKPPGMERHEGGLRYMALEPRVVRRGLAKKILDAIESFPADKNLGARSLVSGDIEGHRTAYLYLQLAKPDSVSYDQYRAFRRHLLEIYSASLLQNRLEVPRVVGIACEPMRLVKGVHSEDMVLIERELAPPEYLEMAAKRKAELGFTTELSSGTWTAYEFPEPGRKGETT